MTETISQLEGTVLSIAGLPARVGAGARFTLSGTSLERDSAFSRPSWIEIDGLDASHIKGAGAIDRRVQGRICDGRFVEVELGDTLSLTGADGDRRVRVAAQSLRFTEYRPPGWGVPAWLFGVLNFRLGGAHRSGALLVTEAQANGAARWYRDTTSFNYAGREWFLSDVLDGKDDKDLRNFKKHWTPVLSAELWTERRADDVRDTIELQARDICNLLSFATGHCVRWLDCTQLDDREQSVGSSGL